MANKKRITCTGNRHDGKHIDMSRVRLILPNQHTLFAALSFFALSVLSPLTAHAEYVITEGKGWRFCEALLKELKRYSPEKPDHCAVSMLRHLPGVTEPKWEELDVSQHEDLLRKLVLYTGISHGPYFDENRRAEAIEKFNNFFPRKIEGAIASAKRGGTRLFVTHVNLQHWDTQNLRPDSTPQTIVRWSWIANPPSPGWQGDDERECMRRYHYKITESPSDFIVKDDLSDIDEVRSGNVSFSSSHWKMLLFYEGKEYLVYYSPSGDGFDVMRDAYDTGYVAPVCSVTYTNKQLKNINPQFKKGQQK